MWFVYILLVLIILSGGYVFLVLPRPKHFRPRSDVFEQTKFFAHRGLFDNGVVAENSLSAFKAAKKFGCGIELDIRLSKDGIPVVMHDRSLIRMCGVNKNVDDLNVDELKKLKLLDTEDCIPTLREVLDLVDGAVPLVIEMKAAGTDVSVALRARYFCGIITERMPLNLLTRLRFGGTGYTARRYCAGNLRHRSKIQRTMQIRSLRLWLRTFFSISFHVPILSLLTYIFHRLCL